MIRMNLMLTLIALIIAASGNLLAQQTPVITLTPASGGVNAVISIRGQGFPPEEIINIQLRAPDPISDQAIYSVAASDRNGRFATAFQLPQAWANQAAIQDSEITVLARSETSDARAAAVFHYNSPTLKELNWREVFNTRFDFSVMIPPNWKGRKVSDGFDLYPLLRSGQERIPVIRVRAVAAPEQFEGQSVAALPLSEVARIPQLAGAGLPADATPLETTAITTRSGIQGYETLWQFGDEEESARRIAYFDLNDMRGDRLYRTVQVEDAGASPLFNLISRSFTPGHQPIRAHQRLQGRFEISLPENWVISNPRFQDGLTTYLLNAPALARENNSFIRIADAEQLSAADAIAELQSVWPDAPMTVNETLLDGRPAFEVLFEVEGQTVSYHVAENDGKVYTLWLHQSDSLSPRPDILASFRFLS